MKRCCRSGQSFGYVWRFRRWRGVRKRRARHHIRRLLIPPRRRTRRHRIRRRQATGTRRPVSYTHLDVYKRQILSIPAGVRSAQRRNRWDDRLLSVISLFGLSFPNFALGPILILLFAIKLGWLPVSGAGSFASLILPAITMGGALAAILTRMVLSLIHI